MPKKTEILIPPGVTGPWTERYHAAVELANDNPTRSCEMLMNLILEPISSTTATSAEADEIMGESILLEDPLKVKEAAIYELATAKINCGVEGRSGLVSFENIRPFFATIPKAKAAKIIRNFIDRLATVPDATGVQEKLCLDTIAWSKEEKRTFLRHRIESRLALLYLQMGRHSNGLSLINELLKEVKKLDDKLLLVEIHYIEAKIYFSIKNIPKAKAALTAARSNSNAIHCPPLLQADIDVLGGALHLEEKDTKTAYSYFFEAFEAYHLAGDERARSALKYGMMSKLLSNQPLEVAVMASQRQNLDYAGRDTEALKKVATSYIKRDLGLFEKALEEYKQELQEDPIICRHINQLYQTLLEQNILKVLKPYSKIEVAHVAKLMNLPKITIQEKLNELILDQQLLGTLDQNAGFLMLFEETSVSSVYADSLTVFSNLSNVVEVLHAKSQVMLNVTSAKAPDYDYNLDPSWDSGSKTKENTISMKTADTDVKRKKPEGPRAPSILSSRLKVKAELSYNRQKHRDLSQSDFAVNTYRKALDAQASSWSGTTSENLDMLVEAHDVDIGELNSALSMVDATVNGQRFSQNNEGSSQRTEAAEIKMTPAQLFFNQNKDKLIERAQKYNDLKQKHFAEMPEEVDMAYDTFYFDPIVRPPRDHLWDIANCSDESSREEVELEQGRMPSIEQIVKILEQEKMLNVKVINLELCGRRDLGMYYILCTGITELHCRRAIRMISGLIRQLDVPFISNICYSVGAKGMCPWAIAHCGPIQVHGFTPEARNKYDLETLLMAPHERQLPDAFKGYYDEATGSPPPIVVDYIKFLGDIDCNEINDSELSREATQMDNKNTHDR